MDAAEGYVEISSFAKAYDLGGWSLTTGAGKVTLPTPTRLGPGLPVILVKDAAAYQERFGPTEGLIELPALVLNPDRDQVVLQDRFTPVDRVAWGGAQPGWTLSGKRTLCRDPAGRDTSSYLDWTLRSAPSPGAPGCGR